MLKVVYILAFFKLMIDKYSSSDNTSIAKQYYYNLQTMKHTTRCVIFFITDFYSFLRISTYLIGKLLL